MYYCNNCGEFWPGNWSYEKHTTVCTLCGSEDIELAGKCGSCGKPIKSSKDYCEECENEANDSIDDLGLNLGIGRKKAIDLLAAIIERE
jgi:hypothetical protein